MLDLKTFSSKRHSKKSAFTLIELSIVLIIIGLLVAGVTGGASLIRSAQLRSVMSEARGFNVAVNAFVVQYDELPGDYGTPIGSSDFGDADGQINYVDTQTALISVGEGINAWHHLADSNTIDESLTALTSNDINITVAGEDIAAQTAGTDVPDSKLDGVGWVFDYNDTASNERNVVIATGTIALVDVAALNTVYHVVAEGAMTPTDALSVDTKLDDGIANSGRVQGSTLLPDAPVSTSFQESDCFTTTTYNTSETGESCALEFTVDIS